MKTVTAKDSQTLLDIAVQELGVAEAAFMLLPMNPTIEGVTDDIPTGTLILLPDSVVKEDVVNFIKENEIIPASAYTVEEGMTEFSEDFDEDFK